MRISHRKRVDKLAIALSKNRERLRPFEHGRSISDASEKVTNSLLELSHRWAAAERSLTPPRYEECCRSQKIAPRSPLLKKMKAIGDHASRLYEFSYSLPCSIDGLYECAKLTDEMLKVLIKGGRIHRFITDAELRKVVGTLKTPTEEQPQNDKPSATVRKRLKDQVT